jgi:hypothetical protein
VAMTIGAKNSAAKGPRQSGACPQAGPRLERAGSGVGGTQELVEAVRSPAQ